MAARRGRPPKSAVSLTREAIIATALDLVEGSPGGLSLRALAAALGVTPMALYPHIGDLDGLLEAMAERCFAEDSAQDDCGEDRDLRDLLLWYCGRVLQYPRLTSAVVARHGTLPAPHQAWTDAVTRCISERGLPVIWRDILVDHLHGFALASAAGGAVREEALAVYTSHADQLLGSMFTGIGKPLR